MKLESLEQYYVHELRDLYYAESQLIKALPKMAAKAQNAKLKRALESHLKETETQRERLSQIFEDLDESPKGETCEAMDGLIKEGSEIVKARGDATTLDAALIASGNRIEHYEIAGYGTARTHAELLGHEEHARLLQMTLDEESAADEKLTAIAAELNPRAMKGKE